MFVEYVYNTILTKQINAFPLAFVGEVFPRFIEHVWKNGSYKPALVFVKSVHLNIKSDESKSNNNLSRYKIKTYVSIMMHNMIEL